MAENKQYIDVLKQIMPQLLRYVPEAIYLVVSNPVDILTYALHRLMDVIIVGTFMYCRFRSVRKCMIS